MSDHEGWLVKKALSFGKDSWKKRYFRLKGTQLSYYADGSGAAKAKGALTITAGTKVREIAAGYHIGRMHELEVFFPLAKETLYAVADDYDDITGPDGWIAHLQRVVESLQPPESPEARAAREETEAAARAAEETAAAAAAADLDARQERVASLRAEEEERKRGAAGVAGRAAPPPLPSPGPPALFVPPPPPPAPTLRPAGTLYCWGAGDAGTLGDGLVYADGYCRPIANATLKGPSAAAVVSAGACHAAALTAKGSLYVWGSGRDGQLGPSAPSAPRPFLMPFFKDSRVSSVACGDGHTLAVVEGGRVYAWGTGREGQLGLGEAVGHSAVPWLIPTVGNDPTAAVMRVYAGRFTSAAVTNKGKAVMWGSAGEDGRLGFGPDWTGPLAVAWSPYEVPVVSSPGSKTVHIVCGDTYTAFLTVTAPRTGLPGRLLVTGRLGVGDAEFAARKDALTFPHVTGLFGAEHVVTALAGGVEHVICLAAGSVYTLGKGYLGGSESDVSDEPVAVGQLDGAEVVSVAACGATSFALTAGGRLYGWGCNDAGQLGNGSFTSSPRPISCGEVAGVHYESVSAGADFVTALGYPGNPPLAPPLQLSPAPAPARAQRRPPPQEGAVPAVAHAGLHASPSAGGQEEEAPPPPAPLGAVDDDSARRRKLLATRQSWRSKSAATAAADAAAAAAQAAEEARKARRSGGPDAARRGGGGPASPSEPANLVPGGVARRGNWVMEMVDGKASYMNESTGETRYFPPAGWGKGGGSGGP